MSQVHAGYDDIKPACSGHAQAGTTALSHVIQDIWGGASDGIYNCRPVRGESDQKKYPSAHGEGRAYDHAWVDAHSGFEIANRIVDHNAALGVQAVIWYRKIWSYNHELGGWRDYHGKNPHTDHIHVEQNWSGALYLTYAAALNALAPIQHPEEPDVAYIYSTDPAHDRTEIFDSGTVLVRIPTPDDAAHLRSVGAKMVELSPAMFDAINAEAKG